MQILIAESWIKARKTIGAVYSKYRQDQCAMLGAALAFHSFFSIFPLLLLFVFLGGDLLASSLVDDFLTKSLTQFVPIGLDTITEIITTITELRDTMGLIGLVGLLWNASSVFAVLETALNTIWRARPRGFWRKRMVATASILVLSLVFITSVTIGQFLPRALALIRLPGIQWISSFFVFLALAFALHVFYRVFPNRKVPFRPAIAAAVAAAMSISAARFVFDIFINSTFADYGAVYGSLAWIVSLALWSYVVATLFLLGAEFGSVLEGIH